MAEKAIAFAAGTHVFEGACGKVVVTAPHDVAAGGIAHLVAAFAEAVGATHGKEGK